MTAITSWNCCSPHEAVDLDYDACVGVSYDQVHGDPDSAMSDIVRKYRALEARCDSVVVLGSDYTDVGNPTGVQRPGGHQFGHPRGVGGHWKRPGRAST